MVPSEASEYDSAIKTTTNAFSKTTFYRKISDHIYTKLESTLQIDKQTLGYIAPIISMGVQGEVSTGKISAIKGRIGEIYIRPDFTYSFKTEEKQFSLKMEASFD